MEQILNITNGDSAVSIMKRAGIGGTLLPWRDVLHDGPVPAGLSLEELSGVRAGFIAERGWAALDAVVQDFAERDELLLTSDRYDKVVLWFEHDLYDQLQILQILDWFNQHRPIRPVLSMICVDQYLGMLSPAQMAAHSRYERVVTEEQLGLASRAWSAFRSATPTQWYTLLQQDTGALPFLAGAILRQLQEFPDCRTGLSRTASQALAIIADGEQRPGRVFGLCQQSEERMFMGDASFWIILQELLESTPPLLAMPEHTTLSLPVTPEQTLRITQAGTDVLAAKRNWLNSMEMDRWIGGVHLTPENCWCWDSLTATITRM